MLGGFQAQDGGSRTCFCLSSREQNLGPRQPVRPLPPGVLPRNPEPRGRAGPSGQSLRSQAPAPPPSGASGPLVTSRCGVPALLTFRKPLAWPVCPTCRFCLGPLESVRCRVHSSRGTLCPLSPRTREGRCPVPAQSRLGLCQQQEGGPLCSFMQGHFPSAGAPGLPQLEGVSSGHPLPSSLSGPAYPGQQWWVGLWGRGGAIARV